MENKSCFEYTKQPVRRLEVMTVIKTVCTKGAGTPDDVHREIHLYWSQDGELLAIYDPTKDSF